MNTTCVCFGEVLFDVLPDQIKASGSPMNVAYHLSVLGHPTVLISRIGSDANGRNLKNILVKKNLSTDHLQTDDLHATGLVIASPDNNGDMSYEIKEEAAWDYIEPKPQHKQLLQNARFFVFGSLATRQPISRTTLFNLLDTKVTRVFDVNLRPPFIDRQRLEYQFSKTDILKMNEDELSEVTSWYVQFNTIEDKIRFLQNRFHIPEIIITRGARGAVINKNDAFFYHPGFGVKVVDTIGSGDSFVAGYLSGTLNRKSPLDALQFACALGAYVASQQGGCPEYTINNILQLIAMHKSSFN